MSLISKKILIIAAVISVIFSVSSPILTQAAVPVIETNPLVTGVLPNDILEFAFKIAVQSLKKKLLDMVVDQITNWIQGGGKPKFVSDWSGFLKDAADQAAGAYLNTLTDGQFCSAQNRNIILNTIPVARFSGPENTCSLSLQGRNLQNFFNNFTNGGWTSWIQLNTQPQNNIFGQYAMTYDNYMIQRTAAQQAALAEAQAGRGFLSVSKCIQYEEDEFGNPTSNCLRSTIVTPGAVVGDLASKALGSDIDFIVNTEDLAAYVAAITNAILNRLFSQGLNALTTQFSPRQPGAVAPAPGFGINANFCDNLLGTTAYNDCLNAAQSGQSLFTFQKGFLISQINKVLDLKTRTRDTKQNTSNILGNTINVINQANACQVAKGGGGIVDQATLNIIISTKAIVDSTIASLNNEVANLRSQLTTVQNFTEVSQLNIVSLDLALNPDVDDTALKSAQSETAQKQNDFLFYQNQLEICQGMARPGEGGGQ